MIKALLNLQVRNFLMFALGTSILCGVLIGELTSVTKYYWLYPGQPKAEISKSFVEDLKEKSETESVYKQNLLNISKVKAFNVKNAVLISLCVLGGLLVIKSLYKKEINKT